MLLYVTKQLAKNVIYQPKFVKIHSVGGTKYKIDVILLGCAIFYSSDTRLHFFLMPRNNHSTTTQEGFFISSCALLISNFNFFFHFNASSEFQFP